MENYLSYDENTGWKVKKSGLYIIAEDVFHQIPTANRENYFVNMYVNGNVRQLDRAHIEVNTTEKNTNFWSSIQAITIYLQENDIIDFELVLQYAGTWSEANFKIEAMFE